MGKDCELDNMREKLTRHETIIYEHETTIDRFKSEITRERESLTKAHTCEINRITQEFEL